MTPHKPLSSQNPLVGTWKLRISRPKTNLPPFLALHTYFADGTMIETTSELGKGGEGLGHGVWEGQEEGYTCTFELFLFSDCGEFTGTARVRTTIHLDDPDHISGQVTVNGDHFSGVADVDLLLPDGTVEKGVDSPSVEGTRVIVEGAG